MRERGWGRVEGEGGSNCSTQKKLPSKKPSLIKVKTRGVLLGISKFGMQKFPEETVLASFPNSQASDWLPVKTSLTDGSISFMLMT